MSIDFDEEKRRLQQMNILAVEKLKAKQPLYYESRRRMWDVKKLLITLGLILVTALILLMLSQSLNA